MSYVYIYICTQNQRLYYSISTGFTWGGKKIKNTKNYPNLINRIFGSPVDGLSTRAARHAVRRGYQSTEGFANAVSDPRTILNRAALPPRDIKSDRYLLHGGGLIKSTTRSCYVPVIVLITPGRTNLERFRALLPLKSYRGRRNLWIGCFRAASFSGLKIRTVIIRNRIIMPGWEEELLLIIG